LFFPGFLWPTTTRPGAGQKRPMSAELRQTDGGEQTQVSAARCAAKIEPNC
ncbi:hypothetical protein QBC45DRAFT_302030, partial [Copromyces sp. CBS 386.78]